nr:PREDICTED: uncharacterized protein LOC102359633 isoform X1 [Latimeria chalumnae]XP_014350341.1 PREDICTED: uncharacterized protein LOC102359633 isoform X1 [Latimeria chalumnae]XP_014350342.1 PREDICTED: uncharacterized protein LOC102359633 isoform X1 [Latimeria chalumnae]|eukprot:XP_014350340.1 PREDICTED: uncharacterized protein LOC102359633 isoform X1 [Latimeria chalumnae]
MSQQFQDGSSCREEAICCTVGRRGCCPSEEHFVKPLFKSSGKDHAGTLSSEVRGQMGPAPIIGTSYTDYIFKQNSSLPTAGCPNPLATEPSTRMPENVLSCHKSSFGTEVRAMNSGNEAVTSGTKEESSFLSHTSLPKGMSDRGEGVPPNSSEISDEKGMAQAVSFTVGAPPGGRPLPSLPLKQVGKTNSIIVSPRQVWLRGMD